jgi:hypothetical protein
VQARVLAPADALVHVCAHGAGRPAPSPRWALDAWWIVARDNVDWTVVVDQASGLRGPVLAALLDWLAAELEAPVPEDVLAHLRGIARTADRVTLELALSLARRRVGATGLVRRAGPDRPIVVRSLVAPSGDYLRLRGVSRGAWMRRGAAGLVRSR